MNKAGFAVLGIIIIILVIIASFLLFGNKGEDKSVVTLYYIDTTLFKLVKQEEVIEGKKEVKSTLNALFKSTPQNGLENLFPEGTEVLDISYDDDKEILIVNLNSNLLSINYGPEVNYLIIMSIVYTASEVSGYSRVKLLFDGNQVEFLNNTIYIGGYFKKDSSVIE